MRPGLDRQTPELPTPASPADVLVIGGGFAGFWAALAARRVLGPAGQVALVSDRPVLQLRPRLYEPNPHTLAIPLEPLLQRCGIGFVPARITDLAPDRGHAVQADGRRWAGRRLVLASGSVMPRPPVPGADAAWSIDTQAEAMALDQRLRTLAAGAHAPVLAVVGAGFTGIELALELRDRLAAHGAGDRAEAARILLVDRADAVGPELGPGPRPAIVQALAAARVECLLGVTLQRITPDAVHLLDRPPLAVDATVLCTGLRAAPLAAALAASLGAPTQDTLDALGRVRVDAHLRVPAAPQVWVAGDAAAADTGGGHLSLQSCQHALRMGRFAGENAARDLLGRPRLRYTHERYVTCLDLGRAGAVFTEGWDRRVRHTGAEAKAVKLRINREVIVPPVQADATHLLAMSRLADVPDEA